MNHTEKVLIAILVVVLFVFAGSSNAHAYLDPGSGSYVLQIILAGIVGMGVTLRVFWTRIKEFFRSNSKKD